jgi:flagellar protein FlaG
MSTKVASISGAVDPGLPQPSVGLNSAGSRAKGSTSEAADLRLVIEEDQESGGFIYKTIDRRTGEVVLQLPRTDVLRMREDRRYSAGSVIRATA